MGSSSAAASSCSLLTLSGIPHARSAHTAGQERREVQGQRAPASPNGASASSQRSTPEVAPKTNDHFAPPTAKRAKTAMPSLLAMLSQHPHATPVKGVLNSSTPVAAPATSCIHVAVAPGAASAVALVPLQSSAGQSEHEQDVPSPGQAASSNTPPPHQSSSSSAAVMATESNQQRLRYNNVVASAVLRELDRRQASSLTAERDALEVDKAGGRAAGDGLRSGLRALSDEAELDAWHAHVQEAVLQAASRPLILHRESAANRDPTVAQALVNLVRCGLSPGKTAAGGERLEPTTPPSVSLPSAFTARVRSAAPASLQEADPVAALPLPAGAARLGSVVFAAPQSGLLRVRPLVLPDQCLHPLPAAREARDIYAQARNRRVQLRQPKQPPAATAKPPPPPSQLKTSVAAHAPVSGVVQGAAPVPPVAWPVFLNPSKPTSSGATHQLIPPTASSSASLQLVPQPPAAPHRKPVLPPAKQDSVKKPLLDLALGALHHASSSNNSSSGGGGGGGQVAGGAADRPASKGLAASSLSSGRRLQLADPSHGLRRVARTATNAGALTAGVGRLPRKQGPRASQAKAAAAAAAAAREADEAASSQLRGTEARFVL